MRRRTLETAKAQEDGPHVSFEMLHRLQVSRRHLGLSLAAAGLATGHHMVEVGGRDHGRQGDEALDGDVFALQTAIEQKGSGGGMGLFAGQSVRALRKQVRWMHLRTRKKGRVERGEAATVGIPVSQLGLTAMVTIDDDELIAS